MCDGGCRATTDGHQWYTSSTLVTCTRVPHLNQKVDCHVCPAAYSQLVLRMFRELHSRGQQTDRHTDVQDRLYLYLSVCRFVCLPVCLSA